VTIRVAANVVTAVLVPVNSLVAAQENADLHPMGKNVIAPVVAKRFMTSFNNCCSIFHRDILQLCFQIRSSLFHV
jgi:hypothetical protein